jgi:signal transduction histidine kinase
MGLLARRLEGDPELGKLADRIFGGIATMNRIIEGMLDFTSDRTVHRTVCAVEDAVMPAAAEVADMAERAGVMLEVSLGEAGEAAIEADVEMMVRVFSNLLRNAIEATPEGGRVTMGGTCGADDDGRPTVTVSVSDTGHGIAEDLRERIFNPFFTTRDTGIGLGLAIVHRTVTAHEGVLRAENNAEGGAYFSVELRSCGAEKS